MKRFPVSMLEEKHRILKQVSALSGETMNSIINDALDAKLYVLAKKYGIKYGNRLDGRDSDNLKEI